MIGLETQGQTNVNNTTPTTVPTTTQISMGQVGLYGALATVACVGIYKAGQWVWGWVSAKKVEKRAFEELLADNRLTREQYYRATKIAKGLHQLNEQSEVQLDQLN